MKTPWTARMIKFLGCPRTLSRYGFALAAVALVTSVKYLFHAQMGETPYLLLLSAVMFSAWYGGRGPGVLATLLGAVVAHSFDSAQQGTPFIQNPLTPDFWLVVFLFEGLLMSWLCHLLHTARQRAEASAHEVQQFHATLRQNEAHLRLLVQGVKDYAILMLDIDGRVASWTKAAEVIVGYREEEIVGQHLSCLYPAAERTNLEQVPQIASRLGRWEQEVECVRKDGTPFWGDVVVTALRDEDGLLYGFSTVIRDITQRKQAEEAHQRRAQQLADANRLKDEFLATVSHELRTPLNSILGWAQLLRGGRLDEQGAVHAMETIEQSAKTQARLIEDLLDISRIITGKMRLDVRAVKLSDVIETAIEIVRPAADAKGIEIQLMLDPMAGPVYGDPNRLQQVIWNLLSNAIKFTARDGMVQVQLSRLRLSSHVEITVKDTGMGISPNFLPYIFDAFRQADSSSTRSHKGLGLGLTIVRHLVELHGGTVYAESDGEDLGATFRVQLPIASVRTPVKLIPASRPPVSEEEETIDDLSSALQGLRVVVVEDDHSTRELVASVLAQWGIEVTAVPSAAEGLEAVRQLKPDALLSDIEMPEEDGYALIKNVRALSIDEGGSIPAVALTAYARQEDRHRALAAGFQMHLAKPIAPDELAAALASVTVGRAASCRA